MPRKAKYGVQFIGYSARVIAREKYGREVDYAMLDFVSGATSMHADGGWVMVPKRTDVEPFLKNLPKLANDLEDRLRQRGGELSQKAVSVRIRTVYNRAVLRERDHNGDGRERRAAAGTQGRSVPERIHRERRVLRADLGPGAGGGAQARAVSLGMDAERGVLRRDGKALSGLSLIVAACFRKCSNSRDSDRLSL
jgi:hypothetical protein